jgi:transitional endoplasmic reticulum ATPase
VTSLSLAVSLRPAALDARRGIVRLHAEVLTALGLQAGDPVRLRGNRTTTGIALTAERYAGRGAIYADDLTLGNLGVRDGDVITVEPVALAAARRVEVTGPVEIAAAVSAETLRLALLSKVVSVGDEVSLLPLDIGGAERGSVAEARRSLSNTVGMGWTTVLLTIADADPADAVMITSDTVVSWHRGAATTAPATRPRLHIVRDSPAPQANPLPVRRDEPASPTRPPAPGPAATEVVPLEELAGIRAEAEELRELLDLAFNHREVLATVGTDVTLGVLLTGPSGTGKTTMAHSVADAVGATIVHIWAPELAALTANDAAAALRRATEQLGAGSMLLVSGVEELAPRDTTTPLSTVFRRTVRDLLADGKAVICTTASPETVSPLLRQPGLLEHEITIPMPDAAARRELLEAFTASMRIAADVRLEDVASKAPGYVAADLLTLVREAGVRAAMRAKDGGATALQIDDFISALSAVRPSSMADSTLELAQISLDDVGDMVEVKQLLTESVLWPLTYPDTFTRLGIAAPRGVLLYGPPGCGKTYLVKAIAGSGKSNVLSVKGAELLNKWVGESEASVRDLFRRARQAAPTLIFFDELDALAPVRGQDSNSGTADRVVAALLTELDGVEDLRNVVVIGATNRPDMIDPALLRPGRLERLVYVPPPDANGRTAILRAASVTVPLSDDVDLADLGASLDNFSAADCSALIREAALSAMRESVEASEVTAAHVADARKRVRPSLDPKQLEWLESYARQRSS